VNGLEVRLVTSAPTGDVSEIITLKHAVTELRCPLGAHRDSVEGLVTRSLVPKDAEASLQFRDIDDHLVRR
jgi:Mg2+ and Co2+ transporter CorA